jgi:hypothetical protein
MNVVCTYEVTVGGAAYLGFVRFATGISYAVL